MSTARCFYCLQFHSGTCSGMTASVVVLKSGTIIWTPPIIKAKP